MHNSDIVNFTTKLRCVYLLKYVCDWICTDICDFFEVLVLREVTVLYVVGFMRLYV